MRSGGFVPASFAVPDGLAGPAFRLVPLGPEHNVADHRAWTSSIEHIRATPGFQEGAWPPVDGMTLEENLGDLTKHAGEFVRREAFTYTVLAPDSDTVIGCLYIYPSKRPGIDAKIRSWVRAADAALDPVLYHVVTDWLATTWPFQGIEYAERPGV